MRSVCVTNNPLWRDGYGETEAVRVMEEAAAADVFIAARDLVHKGWRFAGHPLYGNFSPTRHPYRTLVLIAPGEAGGLDMESLALLEQALEACRGDARDIAAGEMPARMKSDFAMLDRSLMEEIVKRYIGRGGSL